MIEIKRIALHDENDPIGPADYEVKHNGKVVATLAHKVSDGLANLLQAASIAVQMQSERDVMGELEEMAAGLS